MATVDDVARSILASVDIKSQVGPELSATWAFECYKEMVGMVQFKHLRRRFTVYAPAPYTFGPTANATFIQGSPIVNCFGTTFDLKHTGWFIRSQDVWCRIAAVDPVHQILTLESPYSETSAANTTFIAVQRYLPLPPDIRWVGEIKHPRRRKRLRKKTQVWLDYKHPSRLLVGPAPYCWAEAYHSKGETGIIVPPTGDVPESTDARKWIEVYPPSPLPEQYDGTAWVIPDKFEPEDALPPEIDEYVLRDGVLMYYYRSRANTLIDTSPEAAQIMFNMADRQMTKWQNSIQKAIVADRLNDDVEVTVSSSEEWELAEEDIVLARDQVFLGDATLG